MKNPYRPYRRQLPPIPLSHIPRRIRRRMARAQMESKGLRHINKPSPILKTSYFARNWRGWVLGPPRKAGV